MDKLIRTYLGREIYARDNGITHDYYVKGMGDNFFTSPLACEKFILKGDLEKTGTEKDSVVSDTDKSETVKTEKEDTGIKTVKDLLFRLATSFLPEMNSNTPDENFELSVEQMNDIYDKINNSLVESINLHQIVQNFVEQLGKI